MIRSEIANLPLKGTPLTVTLAMKIAVDQAYRGAPHVSPNPMVGCVVLDAKGCLLASGYHEFYGGPHAEVNAVKNLMMTELRGAHVIVTLEPCAHEGKTPSCAKMLSKLPIAKVTYGIMDPNPLVAGQGADILRQSGIEAEVFNDQSEEGKKVHAELEEVCEAFLWNFRQKKVFVALKLASSLDGQVALKSGESQWITGEQSREYTHYLRACYDATLVGKGTIAFDNPSLNIRHSKVNKENKIVIVDGQCEVLPRFDSLKLSQLHDEKNIFWCVAEEYKDLVELHRRSLKKMPQVAFVRSKSGRDLDLHHMLTQLYSLGLRSIMVEGGASIASSFLSDELVNRIYLFQAPIIMGAGGSRSWTESVRISKMSNKIQLVHLKQQFMGQDLLTTGILKW